MKSVEFARTISRLTEEGKKFAVATVVRIEQSASEKYIKQLIDAFSNALSLQKKSAAQ